MRDEVPEQLRSTLETLPASPGVYLMRDAAGKPLYVGKARSLRSRVRSYFGSSPDSRPAASLLAKRTHSIEVLLTDTEKEALILENNLIKKLRPRYNINLRDDKAYLCLRVAQHTPFPRLELVRRLGRDRALYFGPFASAAAIRETVQLLSSTLGLRVCKDAELRNRSRPCPLHEMGYCSAPCVGLISREAYAERLEEALRCLRGDTVPLVRRLEQEMEEAALALDFERAGLLRDRAEAVRRSMEGQKMVSASGGDRDVVGFHRDAEGQVSVQVLQVRDGHVSAQRTFHLPRTAPDDTDVLEEFLVRFYGGDRFVPPRVELPLDLPHPEALRGWLQDRRGGPVRLHHPRRGARRQLLELACRNARQALSARSAGSPPGSSPLEQLRELLELAEPPLRVDCFDVANLQGTDTVAAMSVLQDGQPAPDLYRRYRVRSLAEGQQDDPGALREVLERRYRRAVGEGTLPDLVVIDGGRSQLEQAARALRDLGLAHLPLAGLAKGRGRDGGDRLYRPGRARPVARAGDTPAMHILQRARDEAHRFATTYHRHRRRQGALLTGLEDLPGVGPRTIARLTRHFPTLQELQQASMVDLQHRAGLTARQAQAVHARLRQED